MNSPAEDWPRRHRVSVDEYYRMAEVGLLAPDARVELIEGEIIDMAPIGPGHCGTVNQLTRLLVQAVGERAVVQIQGAVWLDGMSEPQPDVAVLRPRDDFYTRRHAQPADVLLLVEVSDSTLRYDRDVKLPLYARSGIPEVWLVDLQHGEVRFCTDPVDGFYTRQVTAGTPGLTSLAALPGVAVDLSRLLAV